MRNEIIVICAAVLLIAGMNACAPGAGGLSGGSPVEGTSEPGTNEDAGTPQGPGGNLPAGGIAYGVDGAQGTGVDDGTGAPRLGGGPVGALPGPGAPSDATIARGTDVGNPDDVHDPKLPQEEGGLNLALDGCFLRSPVAMNVRPLLSRSPDQAAYVLTSGDAVISVDFFSPPSTPEERRLEPAERLERWVSAHREEFHLDPDLRSVIDSRVVMMAHEREGKKTIAATLNAPRYLLLRGDAALMGTIYILDQTQRVRGLPSVQVYERPPAPPPAEVVQEPVIDKETIEMIDRLRKARQGNTLRMLTPSKER